MPRIRRTAWATGLSIEAGIVATVVAALFVTAGADGTRIGAFVGVLWLWLVFMFFGMILNPARCVRCVVLSLPDAVIGAGVVASFAGAPT
jgi:Na+/melibiose symporter-like transporter